MHAVRYRLMPHTSMSHGPALIRLAPTGQLTVLVDDNYLDPALAEALEELSSDLIGRFTRIDVPAPSSAIRLRIHPTRDAGGKLVVAEIGVGGIDFLVDQSLIQPGLAEPLGANGTKIMRHFM